MRTGILALAALTATPGFTQTAPEETPRGTYLVFADEQSSAFVSVETSLDDANVWPLRFFYYRQGALEGTAQMTSSADCAQGVVSGRLTHATGAEGALLELSDAADPVFFSFDRAGGGGDEAIVHFICGTSADRLIAAETPIENDPATTAAHYAALRALGLEGRLARSLAIRSAEEAGPLVASAVPEDQRPAVRAILARPD
jgi:hypothetical protein